MVNTQVSVIIPLYNAQEFIRETIESVLNQQGCLTEVIVVDDGSSDRSAEIVSEFGDRVRYIRQENSGPAVARNRGIAEACSQWVAFLDSDDLWEPTKLQQQLEVAAATGADVIYTNSRNFGDLSHVGELRLNPDKMPSGDVFEQLLQDNFITMSGVMIRKSVIENVGGFSQQYLGTEDWDLWLRVSAEGAKFQPIPDALTLYRWRSDSLSKNFQKMKQLREATLRAALDSSRAQHVPRGILNSARANVAATSAWTIEEHDRMQAAWWYIQAIACQPLRMDLWKSLAKQLVKQLATETTTGYRRTIGNRRASRQEAAAVPVLPLVTAVIRHT